jgi:hypothetical protein
MKRILIVLVLVAAGVAVLGFNRGWFNLESDSAAGKSNVSLSIDTNKLKEDGSSLAAAAQKLGGKKADTVAGKSHEGKVVSIAASKLVMTNMEGEEEQAHALAAGVMITCDGKVCQANDLRPGMRVRVTTENAEPHAATRIEAIDNSRDF